MTKAYEITGTTSLKGNVNIQGSKNAALPIIIASLLCKDKTTLYNIPEISDVFELIKILNQLNVKTTFKNNILKINSKNIKYKTLNMQEIQNFRASYYFIGLFLSLFKKVEILLPGGCKIGKRPIDQHIKGLQSIGTFTSIDNNVFKAEIKEIIPTPITLDIASFGATINILLASLFTKETITINNAAIEPEIIDLINYLNKLGFNININKNKTIHINPLIKINKANHTIIPDRIVAGTFIIYGALLAKKLKIKNFIYEHNQLLIEYLTKLNVSMKISKQNKTITIYKSLLNNGLDIETGVFPLFPTDLHQVIASLLFYCKSKSTITENLFENRFQYLNEIYIMGGNFNIADNTVEIYPSKINCANINCTDLRGGAALVLLCLKSNGTSVIKNIEYIERGYEKLPKTLKKLGAKINEIHIEE